MVGFLKYYCLVEEVEMVEGGRFSHFTLFSVPLLPVLCSLNCEKGGDPRFLKQGGKTRSKIRLWRDRKYNETKAVVCYSYFHINE